MNVKKFAVITIAAAGMLAASMFLAQYLRPDYEIEFGVGEEQYTVNGTVKQFDEKTENLPFIDEKTGKLFLPLRCVIEEMGGEIIWDAEDECTVINCKNVVMKVEGDSKRASINKYSIILENPPKNINGCLYVTADFIADNFGTEIKWVNEKKQIIITSNSIVKPVVNVNVIEYKNDNMEYFVEVPVITMLNDKNFEKQINSMLHEEMAKDIKKFVDEFKEKALKEQGKKYIMNSKCILNNRTPELVSILIRQDFDGSYGEANKKDRNKTFNIDLQTQKVINLGDLFKNKNYTEILKKEIDKTIKNNHDNIQMGELTGKEEFYIENNEICVIVTDSIFSIPVDDVKKYLKSRYEYLTRK